MHTMRHVCFFKVSLRVYPFFVGLQSTFVHVFFLCIICRQQDDLTHTSINTINNT